jgi:hypothetical protein
VAQPIVKWPDGLSPAENPINVSNEIELSVPPSFVWAKLIKAPLWPDWYRNADEVFLVGNGDELFEGARFTWRTFGIRLDSVVLEFIPQERIAWLATAPGVRAYHAWLITPQGLGCRVLTEETQSGLVARLGRLVFPGRMEMWHQRWLEGLAQGDA